MNRMHPTTRACKEREPIPPRHTGCKHEDIFTYLGRDLQTVALVAPTGPHSQSNGLQIQIEDIVQMRLDVAVLSSAGWQLHGPIRCVLVGQVRRMRKQDFDAHLQRQQRAHRTSAIGHAHQPHVSFARGIERISNGKAFNSTGLMSNSSRSFRATTHLTIFWICITSRRTVY